MESRYRKKNSIEWSEKYGLIKSEQKFLPSREHWEFHLMTNKKDTIIARYDVAFSISQESKRAQRYLYKDLTDEYRKNIQQWIFTP